MLEKLKMLRKEDAEARAIQKERIQDLIEENESSMGVISSLKVKLKEVQNEYDQTIKSVKMLNLGTDSLDSILNSRQNDSSKYGLEFDASMRSAKFTPEVRFVPASVKGTTEPNCETVITNTVAKSSRWVCYYCGQRGHIRKLGHISLRSLDKIIRNEAVVGIPSLDINGKFFWGDCQVGKKTKTSHRSLKECYTIRVLELLHLYLMGPMQTESLGEKKYVLVVVDYYSRFTWVWFLKGKSDTVKLCISLCLNLQREKRQKIIRIRSDHGKEFDNEDLNNFCQSEGIHHEFATPTTPQQNGVVERKNRTLQEMARVMIHAKSLPLNFWTEAVNTVCHIHNKVTTQSADREYHQKWDMKSDQGIFLGYFQNSRAYRVFNIKLGTVMETINVVVNDFESNVNQFNIEDDETSVIPDVTSTLLKEISKDDSQLDTIEPTSVENALKDEYWINAMQEELLQFKCNNVWTLVPKPDGVEGIDFDDTFAPVARLEAIRLLH
ncbi:gag-pol polyprotein [Cucumis melo var. makuwa]|uniref:Gag-pol polyprotein n=1 Tax=Cucumis melo var. makuwa TaxID=1194695 RepID=A0A5A7SWI1_CUCMM|nr:gag-pol polyprotein [Cucumis melo var. makuwa]